MSEVGRMAGTHVVYAVLFRLLATCPRKDGRSFVPIAGEEALLNTNGKGYHNLSAIDFILL